MSELQQTTPPFLNHPQLRSTWGWALGAIMVLCLGLWALRKYAEPVPTGAILNARRSATPRPVDAPAAPSVAEGGAPASLQRVAAASGLPKEILHWLGERDVIRRLAAAVALMAEGGNPRPMLTFLAPRGSFEAWRRKGRLYPAAKSYARYNGITQVVTGLDVGIAVRAFSQMRPFLDGAFAEISRPPQSFTEALRTSIASLTSVEVPKESPELEVKGAAFVYRDARLEALSPAQKQLLRLGPHNALRVQEWLRSFGQALPRTGNP